MQIDAAKPSITVAQLIRGAGDDLRLEVIIGGEGLHRPISNARIQKPGLALTGFTEHIHPERIQVFGNTELSYLRTLTPEAQRDIFSKLFASPLACLIVTKGLPVPTTLEDCCREQKLALMRTPLLSGTFIAQVQAYLEETLTATGMVHGVLVDVFGVGVLLLGKSGIGKSEIALDLIMRGHRLVADDVVNITHRHRELHGTGNDLIRHHMEVRGLGILNVEALFGVAAVRDRKMVELVIDLVEWDPGADYNRLGIEQEFTNLLGIDVPHATIPVRPGRNLTTIVEVAARNQLLKLRGHHSAEEFAERLAKTIEARSPKNPSGDSEPGNS